MIQDANSPQAQAGNQGLFFNTAVLARFLRVCYGASAIDEAQRHVAAYNAAGQFELGEIWKRVVAHLHGVEIKEATRRVLKAAKPLRVKD